MPVSVNGHFTFDSDAVFEIGIGSGIILVLAFQINVAVIVAVDVGVQAGEVFHACSYDFVSLFAFQDIVFN